MSAAPVSHFDYAELVAFKMDSSPEESHLTVETVRADTKDAAKWLYDLLIANGYEVGVAIHRVSREQSATTDDVMNWENV